MLTGLSEGRFQQIVSRLLGFDNKGDENLMKIIILTQKESLYLPDFFKTVCKELKDKVVCIVACPPMSLHGGPLKGFIRNFRLFGMKGTFIIGLRIIKAKLWGCFFPKGPEGPFYSIKQVAKVFSIPYYEIARIEDKEFFALLDVYQPNFLVSVSFTQIIGKNIRDRFPLGCVNLHNGTLPRYRGLLPTFWVLRNGERKTAATVHDLGEKLDDGDILVQREISIDQEDTWDSLMRKTKAASAQAFLEAVQHIKSGTVNRKPNPKEDATYFSFPTASDRKAFLATGRRFF